MTRLARFFLHLVPFSILLVLSSTYFPFIGGKYYLFRILVTLALMAVLASWAFFDDPVSIKDFFVRVLRTPVGLALTIFTGVFILACIFAYDAHAAFWSNFERGEGGFQMIHYYVFFILLAGLFTARRSWRVLFGVSLIAAIGMTLYGVFSALAPTTFIGVYGSVANLGFWQKLVSPAARFQGSLGNAAYVAPYLMFSIFYALWLWADKKREWLMTVGFGVLILWLVAFFFLSQTRGALVGLAAAVFVALLYLGFSRREFRLRAGIVLIVLVVLGGVLFSFRHVPFVQKLPGARLLDISVTDHTFQTRIWNWNAALKGFKERPILGWGPENYPAVFDKFFDTRHYTPGLGGETWFDRAHSVIFDYLVETGIVGLLAYLGLFVAFFTQFFRWVRRNRRDTSETSISSFQEALLFAMPIGYFVQGLVLFDVLPIFLNVIIFLAFSVHIMQLPVATRPVSANQTMNYKKRR